MNPELESLFETFRRSDFPEFMDVTIDNPFVRCPWNGETLLHFVAVWGDVDAARLLLDAGLEVDLVGEDDFTALHHAICQDHVEMTKLLLSRGADPKKRCLLGDAFELAARKVNPQHAKLLADYTRA